MTTTNSVALKMTFIALILFNIGVAASALALREQRLAGTNAQAMHAHTIIFFRTIMIGAARAQLETTQTVKDGVVHRTSARGVVGRSPQHMIVFGAVDALRVPTALAE